jgi:hypothetical protein
MGGRSVRAFLLGLTFPSQLIAESVIEKLVGEQVSVTQLKTLTDGEFEELEITPDVVAIIRKGFEDEEVLSLASNCLTSGYFEINSCNIVNARIYG